MRTRRKTHLRWIVTAVGLAAASSCSGGGGHSDPPVEDITPPAITAWSPAHGQTGVPTTAVVTVTFDEPMDVPSLEAGFTLARESVEQLGGEPVAGTVTWNGEARTATFTPALPLLPGTGHVATVAIGATDVAGNPLAEPWSLAFTTVPVLEVADFYPLQGETDVYTGVGVRLSFLVPMDRESCEAAFTLRPDGGAPVAGTFEIRLDEFYNLVFHPAAPLAPHTTYHAVLTASAATDAGAHLTSDFHLTFTTGAPIQRTLTVWNDPGDHWMHVYGRVTDDLGRIDCGGTSAACTASYDLGTVVTLTASPAPSGRFTGWTGDDGSGTASTLTLTMDTSRSAAAAFEPIPGQEVTLSVTLGAWVGRVYEVTGYWPPPRIDCGPDTGLPSAVCSARFSASEHIGLSASKLATAPAGTLRYTCTSDDLTGTAPVIVSDGHLSPYVWMTRDKSCHVELVVAP